MKGDGLQLILKSILCPSNKYLSTQFVPKHNPATDSDVKLLKQFIFNSKKMLVLTGAGISTESGIPDYRSKEVGLYERANHKPIQHIEFIRSAAVRQRYWARNFVGWFRFSKSQPNSVHISVRDLEIEDKIVHTVVTQNVDGLHFKAGSRNVIELHGTGYRVMLLEVTLSMPVTCAAETFDDSIQRRTQSRQSLRFSYFVVVCLNCDALFDRHYIQKILLENNSVDFEDTTKMIRPDGDVEIPLDFIAGFAPPVCESCGGILKPDITFFGDNVPKQRVDLVREKVSLSDSILVLGSSLSVFSGYRIILQALEEKKNLCIVNIGPTRADNLTRLKIEAKCGDILPKIKTLVN